MQCGGASFSGSVQAANHAILQYRGALQLVPVIGWLSITAWRFFILRKGVSKKR
jgi:hypothetical protein